MANTKIWCLVVDHKNQPIGGFFRVFVRDEIADLQLKVKETRSHDLKDVDAARLEVWKCTNQAIALDRKKLKDQVGEVFSERQVELLEAWQTIADLQVSEQDSLLVRVPDIQRNKRKHDEVEQSDSTSAELKRLRKEVGSAAPSSLAHPGEFCRIAGPDHAIMCNRPFVYDTVPIELLHEAFGHFKDRCSTPPSKKAVAFLAELAPVACKWYGTETERRTEVQRVFEKYTGLLFHAEFVPGTSYITDGNLAVTVMPASIRECKNEYGAALNQAIVYYAKFLIQAHSHSHSYWNYNTRFPCILMVDSGSTFGFYGAVWDGRVRVEPLMPIFDLSTHHLDERGRNAIASSLDAFMEGVLTIQAHYAKIEAIAKANLNTLSEHCLAKARKYPYVASYEIDGRETAVTFETQLHENKLLFSDDSGQYVVKFTRRYSEKAHRYLASIGSAPKLWQCKEIPGGWIAILMEKSSYALLHDLLLPKENQERVRYKVTEIVQKLHSEGLVHGDIRDVNLLVDNDSLLSGGDVRVHFIDFDWAGLAGEAKYPIGVNTISMKRPVGVEDGGTITEEHDKEMVSYLFIG
ncbi:hypothetical protein Moror_5052 [Moniliophthora roreri MCA 2997]|uniref:Protein kinase domain-containing protein n=2 Tax=Moniliophthora roreri TaxID=221103 RepID=V2X1L8_MONRO|nr:hypothetical protein Moror_5052 [Moniliophthora roreri MCA 2997]KAI3614055.1 hypothetical protein WG66_010741 [Moniliophthora roreri]